MVSDVGSFLPTGSEPAANAPADGLHTAVIVSVDGPKREIVIDRVQLLHGEAAVAAAAKAGVEIGAGGAWVVNEHLERLTLKVAPDAAFVVWYPGDSALNVSRPDMAAMSALSFDGFAKFYATPEGRDALRTGGGWVVIDGNTLRSFLQDMHS